MKNVIKKILLTIMILTALYKVTSSQTSTESNVVNNAEATKDKAIKNFELYQNNPVEFKIVTDIKFDIYKAGKVHLYVYNARGVLIETLVDGYMEAGKYDVYFKAHKELVTGVYKYLLEVDGISQSREMVLVN